MVDLFVSFHLYIYEKRKPLQQEKPYIFHIIVQKKATSAEPELWDILKEKKLNARKFRRQYSIDSYIADFCCPSEKLIIELDGSPRGEYHRIEKNAKSDMLNVLFEA